MTMPESTKIITINNNSQRSMIKRSLSESSADDVSKSVIFKSDKDCFDRKMWQNELEVNAESDLPQPQQIKHHNNIRTKVNYAVNDLVDTIVRIVMVIVFIKLEITHPFKRKIQVEELWLYKNPRTEDIVSPTALLISVILGPFSLTLLHLIITRSYRDFRAANWAWTLAVCLNGITTSLLKVTVGRPRPDFFFRCFPDGIMKYSNNNTDKMSFDVLDFDCTGNINDINEGYKSFPSGHSSFAFASFGFISFFLSAKLHIFDSKGRGQTWRLCIAIAPLMLATLVAVSRTCDYHHHWQDVFVGGLIGLFVSFFAYRQYYPSIFSNECDKAYSRNSRSNHSISDISQYARVPKNGKFLKGFAARSGECSETEFFSDDKDEYCPLIDEKH